MTAGLATKAFDYTVLPLGVADEARSLAARLRAFERSTTETVIALGRELIGVKGKLGHGNFGAWLKSEFPHGARTAQNFMTAAEAFGDKSATVSHLPAATVYRLAAPATPAAFRQDFVRRLDAGEQFDPGVVDHLVREARHHADQDRRRAGRRASLKRAADPAVQERRRRSEERQEREARVRQERVKAALGAAVAIILDALAEDALTGLLGYLDETGEYTVRHALRAELARRAGGSGA